MKKPAKTIIIAMLVAYFGVAVAHASEQVNDAVNKIGQATVDTAVDAATGGLSKVLPPSVTHIDVPTIGKRGLCGGDESAVRHLLGHKVCGN